MIGGHLRFAGLLGVAVAAFALVPRLGGDYAIGVALKDQDDLEFVRPRLEQIVTGVAA